jgi:2-hydroxy-3-oxopropionate reductase
LDIALKTGESLGVSMEGTAQVASQMTKAIEQGKGELDHSALYLMLQK